MEYLFEVLHPDGGYELLLDPANPRRLGAAADSNFSYWHSATFNNDGTKVLFTDEWGGGGRPRCLVSDPRNWGANAIYDIEGQKLRFRNHYKLPAAQTSQENCVAHNGSIIPVPGRDLFVQAWYQGGISISDFTDSTRPTEIGCGVGALECTSSLVPPSPVSTSREANGRTSRSSSCSVPSTTSTRTLVSFCCTGWRSS